MPKGTQLTAEQKAAKEAEKASKFIELADKRVNAALDKIALIGGLSAKASYSYTPEQAMAIKGALEAEVNRTMARFSPDGPKVASGFSVAAAVAAVQPQEQPKK